MSYNAKTGNYLTPVGRFSFPVLDQPKQINQSGDPKYQLTILFDKEAQGSQDFKDMQKAVEDAIAAKWGQNRPRKIKVPFMTIDDLRNKVPAGYEEEHVFIRLTSTAPVGVVVKEPDGTLRRVEGPEIKREAYAGCYGKASINVYAWSHPTGGAGVSFGLANVMKTDDGEPFGASNAKAEDDFGAPVTGGGANADFME